MNKNIMFEKHTIEYFEWYAILEFLKEQTGLTGDVITDWVIGDYNNDQMFGLDFKDSIEQLEGYTGEEHKLIEPLQRLQQLLGNDITVQISW